MRDALVAPTSADAAAGSVSVSVAYAVSVTVLSCPAGEAATAESPVDPGEAWWIAAVAAVAAPAVALVAAAAAAAAVAVGESRTRETAMADNVRASAVEEETHWRRWSWRSSSR